LDKIKGYLDFAPTKLRKQYYETGEIDFTLVKMPEKPKEEIKPSTPPVEGAPSGVDVKVGDEIIYLNSLGTKIKSITLLDSQKLEKPINNVDATLQTGLYTHRTAVNNSEGKTRRLYWNERLKIWVFSLDLNRKDTNEFELANTPNPNQYNPMPGELVNNIPSRAIIPDPSKEELELTRTFDVKSGDELVYIDSDKTRKKSLAMIDSEKLKTKLEFGTDFAASDINYRIFVIGDAGKSRRLYFKNSIKAWIRDLSFSNLDKNPVPEEISGSSSVPPSGGGNYAAPIPITKPSEITAERLTKQREPNGYPLYAGNYIVAFDDDLTVRIKVEVLSSTRELRKTPLRELTHKVVVRYGGERRNAYWNVNKNMWVLIS
jgi:hypothetical protein